MLFCLSVSERMLTTCYIASFSSQKIQSLVRWCILSEAEVCQSGSLSTEAIIAQKCTFLISPGYNNFQKLLPRPIKRSQISL